MNFTVKQFLIAIDQLFNVLLGGWADETLSTRSYRLRDEHLWWAYGFINTLFFWMEDHCKEGYLSEKNDKQLPPEYRK